MVIVESARACAQRVLFYDVVCISAAVVLCGSDLEVGMSLNAGLSRTFSVCSQVVLCVSCPRWQFLLARS